MANYEKEKYAKKINKISIKYKKPPVRVAFLLYSIIQRFLRRIHCRTDLRHLQEHHRMGILLQQV